MITDLRTIVELSRANNMNSATSYTLGCCDTAANPERMSLSCFVDLTRSRLASWRVMKLRCDPSSRRIFAEMFPCLAHTLTMAVFRNTKGDETSVELVDATVKLGSKSCGTSALIKAEIIGVAGVVAGIVLLDDLKSCRLE